MSKRKWEVIAERPRVPRGERLANVIEVGREFDGGQRVVGQIDKTTGKKAGAPVAVHEDKPKKSKADDK